MSRQRAGFLRCAEGVDVAEAMDALDLDGEPTLVSTDAEGIRTYRITQDVASIRPLQSLQPLA